MAHKGIKEFTAEELSSVALGQNGFNLLVNGAFATSSTVNINNDTGGSVSHTGKEAGTYWIALKAVGGSAVVSARSYGAGDDLSATGAYDGGAQLTLADGDIVYGAFDAATVDASKYVIAYIGK
jgi:hypothetical protein